jgi:hypothetical protein
MRAFPGATALTLVAAVLGAAAAFEAPRTFTARELLKPAQIKGPHHTVADAVRTEGYLHVFDITSDFGPLEAEGEAMLLLRLHEVGALAELDKVSKSEVFLKAAGTSVLNVGRGFASAVRDPGATARGVGGGVRRLGTNLGRKAQRTTDRAVAAVAGGGETEGDSTGAAAGVANAGAGIANSMLGVTSASRRWAQKIGVDPYTTNPILRQALSDIGRIDAAGSLAARIAVPVPMVVSSTASVGNLVWSKDPEALLKMNEQTFGELGVGADTMRQQQLSRGFTVSLHTRLATSLGAVRVPGCGDYVATAAESGTEREALFFVESAAMLARFHETRPVVAVLPDSRALVAKTRDGRAVVMLPVDWVRWTEAYAEAVREVEARAQAELGATQLELRMTGTMSKVAGEEMARRGWTVAERVPSSFAVALPEKAPAS